MRVLIVHAHHEPQSFSSALFRRAAATLQAEGHHVVVSDLYRDGFNPVSGRANFTTVFDPHYLKQQAEERHAAETGGFAPELEAEIRKLETCDLLIFSFPLWWFSMPAILKGWVDRVFAVQRIYGGGKTYEKGLGQARKRAMVILTTGGRSDAFGAPGKNPSIENILIPIEHGIFRFNGFVPLAPYIAWAPARASDEEREAYLDVLERRMRGIAECPVELARNGSGVVY